MAERPDGKFAILIVEDDADTRDSVRELLEAAGYAVATAATGMEGLRYLQSQPPPCLILLDLMMPMGNGWVFRLEQQRDPALAKIPVVIWSGVHDPAPVASYLRAAGFLTKPLDVARLFEQVQRYCG